MPESHGFTAWVTIEDTKTPEFDVRRADSTVTCWIPSEVGKKFSIHWSNLSVPGITGGHVLVDGNSCNGQILARKQRPTSTFMGGMNETTTSVRPFVFRSLDMTEDDADPDSIPDQGLGSIVLEIWKVEKNDVGRSAWANMAAPTLKKIQERSKKAITQQIGFCDSVDRPPVKVLPCKWKERIVTFSFKYRPLELFRANGIAPPLRDKGKQKASPVHECVISDDEEDSDTEEARMLENRLSEIRAKRNLKNPRKRKFKVEDDGDGSPIDSRSRKRIKFEDDEPGFNSGPGGTRIKAEVKPEFIDLTQPKKRIKHEGRPVSVGEVIDLT